MGGGGGKIMGNLLASGSQSVPGVHGSNRGSISEDDSRTLDSIEFELEQRQRLMAWAQMQSNLKADRPGSSPPLCIGEAAGPSSASQVMGGGQESSRSNHGAGRPVPDYIRLPGEEGAEEEDVGVAGEEDLEDLYAGEIHKPAVFHDEYDGNKE